MADKYRPGDVLENCVDKTGYYTFVLNVPTQTENGTYRLLDLVLQPSQRKIWEEGSTEGGAFRIPAKALRVTHTSVIAADFLYRKIDHIDFGGKGYKLTGLVGASVALDIPELEKYLRVDRNY